MAVDTAEKRFSMMGVGNSTVKHVLPQGALGASGRATLMDLYSGIALLAGAIMQKGWDYITGNALTLQVKTEVKSIDIQPEC